ncbi:hypothetical protein HON36_05945 [Candidatus Parcubacteria bacterium]|jgi:predicted RND superfamily exporter protein|nr:hypothetical protein [Candidatus Parcubacteria bacterium]MBT7228905.1 hypothetical protein [Candidatus Parcubacteria bacterium]
MDKTLFWTPRAFAILFNLSLAFLAVDIFETGFSWMGLLTHLLPAIICLIVLIIAWFQESIGGLLFIILGIVYIVMFWGDFGFLTYLVMAGPAFVIGILFFVQRMFEGGQGQNKVEQNTPPPIMNNLN